MRRDELTRRLDEAGGRAAPPADAAFADALEARLRSVHAGLDARDAASAHPHAGPAPVRAWWRSPVPVAAAAALLLVVSLGVVATQQRAVTLAAAFDAVVVYPDGRTVRAHPGLELQEGAVVRTGAAGHVLADGVRLGPGESAVVTADGDLRRVPQPPPKAAPATPRAPAPRTPQKPSPAAEPSRVPALPPVEVVSTPREPSQPERTPPPREGATERDAPSTGEDDAVAEDQAEPDASHQLGLTARQSDRAVLLGWTATDHPHFGLYVVLRAPYPQAPEWPVREGSATRMIGRTVERDHVSFMDGEPLERGVYRVVALDDWGREIGRSHAVSPSGAKAY